MTRTRRLGCTLRIGGIVGGLLLSVTPLAAVSTAQAADDRLPAPSLSRYGAIEQRSSAYLCTGYVACAEAGYSHFGYRTAGSQMFWRMYAGHNCTNYVAYRMVRSGLPNERPWTGGGNATEWGAKKAGITDAVPTVGSVAWWRANAPGTGSSGHVAYVEEVVSSTVIVVSEDSWGGDFHWRTIRKADGRWPSGFIHFNDLAVTNVEPPVVQGTPRVGSPLLASAGTWKPAGSYAFQWLVDGAAISGATAARYVPTPAQRGKRLTVQVTASKKGYAAATARTPAPDEVRVGEQTSTAAPVVSGVAEVDEVLTVTAGGWSPEAGSTTVQWYADGADIAGATGPQLRLGQGQIDARITAAVVARTPGYAPKKAVSEATAPVIAGTIAITQPFALTGLERFGRTLTVAPGVFEPSDATLTYTWLRDGEPIAGATGPSYELRGGDVGSHISVRVDLSRASYRSTSQLVRGDSPVMTKPVLHVKPASTPRRAVVIVRVAAPGVARPTGTVTVSIGARKVTAEVVAGRARVVLDGLTPGWKKVRVLYSGGGAALAAAGSERLFVKK